VFRIEYDADAVRHLRSIERKHHSLIRDTVDAKLSHQANQPTRNRKLLRQPAPWGATWELRCGPQNRFRVFYRLDDEGQVRILAIGVKEGNRLLIEGEEYHA
jgi:mRNA-degrading endonuclease RelE of RelBE toxin-antitoxin system